MSCNAWRTVDVGPPRRGRSRSLQRRPRAERAALHRQQRGARHSPARPSGVFGLGSHRVAPPLTLCCTPTPPTHRARCCSSPTRCRSCRRAGGRPSASRGPRRCGCPCSGARRSSPSPSRPRPARCRPRRRRRRPLPPCRRPSTPPPRTRASARHGRRWTGYAAPQRRRRTTAAGNATAPCPCSPSPSPPLSPYVPRARSRAARLGARRAHARSALAAVGRRRNAGRLRDDAEDQPVG